MRCLRPAASSCSNEGAGAYWLAHLSWPAQLVVLDGPASVQQRASGAACCCHSQWCCLLFAAATASGAACCLLLPQPVVLPAVCCCHCQQQPCPLPAEQASGWLSLLHYFRFPIITSLLQVSYHYSDVMMQCLATLQVVDAAILRQASFILADPWANSFRQSKLEPGSLPIRQQRMGEWASCLVNMACRQPSCRPGIASVRWLASDV
jgi:hypothetical protein